MCKFAVETKESVVRVNTIGYILISVKILLTYGKFNRLLESSLRELHFGKFCADFHSLVFHHHSYYNIHISPSYQLFHWYSHCYYSFTGAVSSLQSY